MRPWSAARPGVTDDLPHHAQSPERIKVTQVCGRAGCCCLLALAPGPGCHAWRYRWLPALRHIECSCSTAGHQREVYIRQCDCTCEGATKRASPSFSHRGCLLYDTTYHHTEEEQREAQRACQRSHLQGIGPYCVGLSSLNSRRVMRPDSRTLMPPLKTPKSGHTAWNISRSHLASSRGVGFKRLGSMAQPAVSFA